VGYTFSAVNDATLSQAPDSIQFGAALLRFLQRLARADTRRCTIKLAKTDISDAFMRVWILLETIPCLGAILPSYPGKEPLIAFTMILPMGWVDSPNYLCDITETTSQALDDNWSRLAYTDSNNTLVLPLYKLSTKGTVLGESPCHFVRSLLWQTCTYTQPRLWNSSTRHDTGVELGLCRLRDGETLQKWYSIEHQDG
jgi:hypothetical protein